MTAVTRPSSTSSVARPGFASRAGGEPEEIVPEPQDKVKTLAKILETRHTARLAELVEKYESQALPVHIGVNRLAAYRAEHNRRAAAPPALPDTLSNRKARRTQTSPWAAWPAGDLLALARQCQQSGEHQMALELYGYLVAQRKHLSLLIVELAVIAAESPWPVKWLQLLGDAYTRADRPDRALEIYRQALQHLGPALSPRRGR